MRFNEFAIKDTKDVLYKTPFKTINQCSYDNHAIMQLIYK